MEEILRQTFINMEENKKLKVVFNPKITEGNIDDQLKALERYFDFTDEDKAEARLSMSCRHIGTTVWGKYKIKLPIIHYCWDFYKWALQNPGAHYKNHEIYADELSKCDLVVVPSHGQQQRLKELININSIVVTSGFTHYEQAIMDSGFILDPLREYPEENKGWAEQAAKELDIPFLHTEHQFTKEKFEKLVASCSFLTSCYREASTGALSLMEGLWLGKKSLVSNSPYQGAKDYLGKYAVYFQYDSFEDLKAKMKEMWETRPKVEIIEARTHLENYSYDAMAHNLYESIFSFLTANR